MNKFTVVWCFQDFWSGSSLLSWSPIPISVSLLNPRLVCITVSQPKIHYDGYSGLTALSKNPTNTWVMSIFPKVQLISLAVWAWPIRLEGETSWYSFNFSFIPCASLSGLFINGVSHGPSFSLLWQPCVSSSSAVQWNTTCLILFLVFTIQFCLRLEFLHCQLESSDHCCFGKLTMCVSGSSWVT